MRPTFVLDDVSGAELIHVKRPHSSDVPSVVLTTVKDFSVSQSRLLADTQIESAEQQTL